MEKVIGWIKERIFLLALVLFGLIYLTVSGEWSIYTAPVKKVASWFGEQFGSDEVSGDLEQGLLDRVSDGDVSMGDVSDGEAEGPAVSAGDVSSGNDAGEISAEHVASDSTISGSDVMAEEEKTKLPSTVTQIFPDKDAAKRTEAGITVSAGDSMLRQNMALRDEEEEEVSQGVVYTTVSEEYFADALFIGDSRTVGMYEYGGLEDIATFYATTGLTVHKVLGTSAVETAKQQNVTIEEALRENHFAKIYFMLGINEMGTGTVDTFMDKYAQVVEYIKEVQPDAVLYLQGIMKVTAERSAKGDYINNEGIAARNERIAALADDRQVFYLDMNEAVCDANGGLKKEYTGDGVHLKAQYYDLWKEFLLEHAVEIP